MREIKFRAWDKEKQEFINKSWIIIWIGKETIIDSKNRFELMQYTGLKDKNGKEIYENDIVKVFILDRVTICEVRYGEYHATIGINFTSDTITNTIRETIVEFDRYRPSDNSLHQLSMLIAKRLNYMYGSLNVGWYLYDKKNDRCYGITKNNSKMIEIIGNIHENPELLKKKV